MYLARLPGKKDRYRFMIRHSYSDGGVYRSRDLFDLGSDPSVYIVYPGGNSFYIDAAVEDGLAARGVPVSQDDLEPMFRPFLAPHIRRVIEGFDRRRRSSGGPARPSPAPNEVHRFDRYRLQFLKLGRVVRRERKGSLDRLYTCLRCKSRDEIEWDFFAAERRLKPTELAHYTYHIFNLPHDFGEFFAHSHPQALDRDRMDRYFVRSLCRLNRDEAFWSGCDHEDGLRRHLVRYAVMYFDSEFFAPDPMGDFLRDFMDRHRVHQTPHRVQLNLVDSARLFGVSVENLKKMDRLALTRQYRRRALRYHPDKGGDQAAFIKLAAAYHQLLKRKTGRL